MKHLLAALILIFAPVSAYAHTEWQNGDPIPAWIKSACCGPSDAHIIDESEVHAVYQNGKIAGYRVDNVGNIVSPDRVFPSQDGATWIFYNPAVAPEARFVYCLFIPWSG